MLCLIALMAVRVHARGCRPGRFHTHVRDLEDPKLFCGRLCNIPSPVSQPEGLNGGRDDRTLALAVPPRIAARAEPRMRVGQRRTDFERSSDTVRRISTRGNASLDF